MEQVVASPSGDFEFHPVPAGSYVVKVAPFNGFAFKSVAIHVPLRSAGIIIKLEPERVVQTVTVEQNQTISTDPTANKDTVSYQAEDLHSIPVFDQDVIGAVTPFLDAGSISSGGVSIVVDGVEMKNAPVSPSGIAEVGVNNDPYSAEFGRPGRGRIEIVTKPGTPQYHGELNFTTRDATFNANNYFSSSKPPEQRRIFEGNVTGPIGHSERTTFLLSANSKIDNAYSFVHAVGAQGVISGNVPSPEHDTETSLRAIHDFSNAHRLSVGYNFELDATRNALVGGIVLPEAGSDSDSREDDLIINDRIIVSPAIVNQLQITLEKDEDVTKSVTNAPSIQVNSSFTGGGAQSDVARSENTIHISEVASVTHKNHYLRFGANIPQISRRAVDDRSNRLGTFGFNSLADYEKTIPTPYVFTSQQGPGRGIYWMNEIGGFIQDQIRVTPKILLTLGLRYQWQTYISDKKNFAPRASLADSFNSKTILRIGCGVFFDRTGGDFPATFKLHNGVVLHSYQVLSPGYPNPLAPGQSFSAMPSNIVRTAPNGRTPYTIQYSIGIERQLTPKLTVTASYRGITGVASFRSRDVNAPRPPQFTQVPDPSLGFIQQVEAAGRSSANALDVSLRGRAGRWFTGQAQYTVGRSYDNTGGIRSYQQDQYNPNALEWGPSNFDRLHRLKLLGTVNQGHWLSLGVGATAYSGTPYTELAGSDFYNTGLGNARPAGVGRNTVRAGGTADLDTLWNHEFKLGKSKANEQKVITPGISAFNILNHPNFTDYIGNIRSSLFKQPTIALSGRQLQFSVGFQF